MENPTLKFQLNPFNLSSLQKSFRYGSRFHTHKTHTMELFCYSIILGLSILIFLQTDEVEYPENKRITPLKTHAPPLTLKMDKAKPVLADWKTIKENYLKVLSSFKDVYLEEVYYVIVNYTERDFAYENFHLCDVGVLLKFSDGRWINWIWEEEGIHGTPEYQLSFTDKRGELKDFLTPFHKVSDTKAWKKVSETKLTEVSCTFEETGKEKGYLSKMILQFDSFVFTICSIEEPDPYNFPDIEPPVFAPDWTIIHF